MDYQRVRKITDLFNPEVEQEYGESSTTVVQQDWYMFCQLPALMAKNDGRISKVLKNELGIIKSSKVGGLDVPC